VTTEVTPVDTFHMWIRPPLAYATRGPSMATDQTGPSACFTLFACVFAAEACVERSNGIAARNSPTTESLVMGATLTRDC